VDQLWIWVLQITDFNMLHTTKSTPCKILYFPTDWDLIPSMVLSAIIDTHTHNQSTLNQLLRTFPNVFKSCLGHCIKLIAHLQLKEGAIQNLFMLDSCPLLSDPKLPIILAANASPEGVCATIMHQLLDGC